MGAEGDGANDPENVKLTAPPDFDGPGAKRKCTDVLCCLLIIGVWVAMTGLGMVVCGAIHSDSLPKGNPYRLINGMDYLGNICGITDEVCGVGSSLSNYQDDCTDSGDSNHSYPYSIKSRSKAYYLPSGSAVCVSSCPGSNKWDEFICEYDYMAKLADIQATSGSTAMITKAWEYVEDLKCMPKVATTDYVGYCVPDAATSALEESLSSAASAYSTDDGNTTISINSDAQDKDIWEKFQADMFTGSGIIFGFGLGVTALLGFVYLYMLRIPGCLFTLVWGIIAAIEALVLLPGLILLVDVHPSWEENDARSDVEARSILYLAYFLLALAALWACIVCCLRKRIMLALGITQEAARAVNCMPAIITFPVLQALGVCVFMVPWVFYSLFLASSGNLSTKSYDYNGVQVQYKEFTYSDNQYYAGLFLLFTYFWTTQFVVALGQLVVAMAVSTWYFSRPEKKATLGSSTVVTAIKRSLYYHMGTCAFGSLIIAIIKTIRAIVAYLQKKAKKSKSKLAQAVLCCIQCCLWCIEKCMKFINKNAYIQTAIFGYSFCKAARKAFWLILRNLTLIAAVGIVAEIVGLLGKILVPAMCGFLAFLALSYGYADALYTLWTPLIFTLIISYFTTEMFIEIFQMAISTILQCYVADKEMFPDNMFADGTLAATIGKTKSKSAEVDEETSGGCCGFGKSSKVATAPPAATAGALPGGNVEMTEVEPL